MSNPAVFLDRDGTVIVDHGYLDDADRVELLPGAAAALQRLRDAGFRLVLITNQSGIGRGYFGHDAVAEQHERLLGLLRECGVELDAIGICPHEPDEKCDCLKPNPKMVLDAAAKKDLDLSRSYMVGHKPSDIGAGHAAGCRSILVGDRQDKTAEFHARDLADAVDWILHDVGKS